MGLALRPYLTAAGIGAANARARSAIASTALDIRLSPIALRASPQFSVELRGTRPAARRNRRCSARRDSARRTWASSMPK